MEYAWFVGWSTGTELKKNTVVIIDHQSRLNSVLQPPCIALKLLYPNFAFQSILDVYTTPLSKTWTSRMTQTSRPNRYDWCWLWHSYCQRKAVNVVLQSRLQKSWEIPIDASTLCDFISHYHLMGLHWSTYTQHTQQTLYQHKKNLPSEASCGERNSNNSKCILSHANVTLWPFWQHTIQHNTMHVLQSVRKPLRSNSLR